MSGSNTFHPYVRQCQNPECRFRYPVTEITGKEQICPACHGATTIVVKYPDYPHLASQPPNQQLCSLLLDNIRSVFNTGSIFRSADGCGWVEHLYLCGITPTPQHRKMAKTSLGAEDNIPWSYHPNALILAQKLMEQGYRLIALEATPHSVPLSQWAQSVMKDPFVVMVGNEVAGIDPALLALAETHVHLPMHGIKESLNVAIAASIMLYSHLD